MQGIQGHRIRIGWNSNPADPMGFRRRGPQHESCRKISHKLRPLDMEITSEIIYWAVLLYVPIYWFIGLIVLGGCFIAGTIWCVLRHAFISPYNSRDVQPTPYCFGERKCP